VAHITILSLRLIGETEENQKNASFKSQCLSQDLKRLPPKSKIECSWRSRRKGMQFNWKRLRSF
jgi:hypothetical protein